MVRCEKVKPEVHSDMTKGNGHKLQHKNFWLNDWRKSFTVKWSDTPTGLHPQKDSKSTRKDPDQPDWSQLCFEWGMRPHHLEKALYTEIPPEAHDFIH